MTPLWRPLVVPWNLTDQLIAAWWHRCGVHWWCHGTCFKINHFFRFKLGHELHMSCYVLMSLSVRYKCSTMKCQVHSQVPPRTHVGHAWDLYRTHKNLRMIVCIFHSLYGCRTSRASENRIRQVRCFEAQIFKQMNEWKKHFGLQTLHSRRTSPTWVPYSTDTDC